MDEKKWLAEQFEANRAHLRKVAHRMLGSVSDADDAVQQSWLRISRADARDVENLSGWLTTIVGRVCLDMLRTRKIRGEEALGPHIPEPLDAHDPEHDSLIAESIGLALLVILEKLSPAERTAYVLHDMFDLPFDQIAPIVGRSTEAARQLASRARRRVQGGDIVPDPDRARQREIVEAFLLAARTRDFDALIAVLDPDVVLRADQAAARSEAPIEVRGASAVARGALSYSGRAASSHLLLVNGAIGTAWFQDGRLAVVSTLSVENGKVVSIDIIADPERLRGLDLGLLDDLRSA
jgi:RNA polymerase sigma factor (sigma-70 family)